MCTPRIGEIRSLEGIMEQTHLRLLIQERLADGRLPSTSIPRAGAGPGNGQPCDACGKIVTTAQTMIEHLDEASHGIRFHVACFHVWNVERQMAGQEPSVRLPARSAFRAPGARPNRPWAPSAPLARPASVPLEPGTRGAPRDHPGADGC
jgi:hypothetical protein